MQAVLAGDFILAVSSVALSQVNNPLVVELMSQILDNLVKGDLCINNFHICICFICLCVKHFGICTCTHTQYHQSDDVLVT